MRVSPEAVGRFRAKPASNVNPFKLPEHPPGVKPSGAGMAMDDAFAGSRSPFGWAQGLGSDVLTESYGGRTGFIGYTVLAELAQLPEYRKISETVAKEMTRRWIELQSSGEDDKSDKIAAINADLVRLRAQDVFRLADVHDGLHGGGHIFLDTGNGTDQELTTSIGDGSDQVSKAKIGKGGLKALRNVEPVWVYPQGYNATNPLAPDWYSPTVWGVMGKQVHASRLLTIVGREVPDMLKPAYSFRGLSMSQMALPYIENWLRTRQNVADIVEAFSVFVLKTDLASVFSGGDGASLDNRLSIFNSVRDNSGVMAIQSGEAGEEFQNVAAPLGTLDALQAQSQEQMASVSSIPLVKLLGITPSGLNASSEGEIRVFYDDIHAAQEHKFRRPLTTIINMIQLSLFGAVDPAITFRFVPLWSMSEKEEAEVKLTEAQTGAVHIEAGVLFPEEERTRIANDPDTLYPGLDLSLELNPPQLGEQDDLPDVPKPSSGTAE